MAGMQKYTCKKGVIPKWHNKINQFNAKTVVKTSSGLQTNKLSTKKKVLVHRSGVKIVE